MIGESIQGTLKLIRFGINILFVFAIVALVLTLLINFIMAIQGFVSLLLPFENSLIRDIYLLINLWSPINLGIIFNHIILIISSIFGIMLFLFIQKQFNISWGN